MITLDGKQQQVLDLMMSDVNVYLTGYAGTGKTVLLREYIDRAEAAGKSVLVCATTGMAADNLGYGAGTIHRTLGISTHMEDYAKRVKYRNKFLRSADVLVIDEISMCRSDLFSAIGRMIEYENNRRTDERIIGENDREDLQIIVCGDFSQLPPVITAADREVLISLYGNSYEEGGNNEYGYAYNSEYWKHMEFQGVCLTHVYRQQDSSYLYVLQDIRSGNNIRKAIDYLEENAVDRIIPDAPFLVPRNAEADRINHNYLGRLDKATEVMLRAEITGKLTPADIKNINFAPEDLIINIDAQVMITVNDPDNRYVNGTIGKIIDIVESDITDDEYILVRTAKGEIVKVYRYVREIERQEIETVEKELDGEIVIESKIVRKVIGTYSQFPLKLAWAISIHKSQGQTFDAINIDPRCWEIGQFYTAVSRAKSAEGIHFLRQLMSCYIKVYPIAEAEKLKDSLVELL